MEKLVDLLNEYGNGYFELDDEGGIVDSNQDTFEVTSYYITMQIISKRFGFIDRLVKNDKIDLEEVEKINQTGNVYIRFGGDCEKVLMLLSIQDNPIEYLCSILKE